VPKTNEFFFPFSQRNTKQKTVARTFRAHNFDAGQSLSCLSVSIEFEMHHINIIDECLKRDQTQPVELSVRPPYRPLPREVC
jgi:hypothetical protein